MTVCHVLGLLKIKRIDFGQNVAILIGMNAYELAVIAFLMLHCIVRYINAVKIEERRVSKQLHIFNK